MLIKLVIGDSLTSKINSINKKSQHIYHRTLSRIQGKVEVPIPVLIESLKDEEGQIRWYAAWALSRIGSEAKLAVNALIEALKDEEGEVRILAAKALTSMGSEIEIPVPILAVALDDQERYVRNFAAKRLEQVNRQMAKKTQQQNSEISL